MSSDFKILISSDDGYNELCAEIFFKGLFVAIISQEEGFDNLKIAISPKSDYSDWVFNFSEFENILKSAKNILWEMRKEN